MSSNGKLPLSYAIETENIETVKLLISSGANLHYSLYEAAQRNNIEIIKLLIASGANINVKNEIKDR